MDTLLESAFGVVSFVVRGVLFNALFYWPGWLVLRIITLGDYPPAWRRRHNRDFVSIIGFAAACVLFVLWGLAVVRPMAISL